MRNRRDVADQLAVRVPGLARAMTAATVRLKLGSETRRRLMLMHLERSYSAMARHDIDLLVLAYSPAAEIWMRSMAGVGLKDHYRGHDGVRAILDDFNEAFVDWRWTPRGMVDGGDRFAIRADLLGYGRRSGAEIAVTDGGTAATVSPRGEIVWQEWFVDHGGWSKALRAVGLSA